MLSLCIQGMLNSFIDVVCYIFISIINTVWCLSLWGKFTLQFISLRYIFVGNIISCICLVNHDALERLIVVFRFSDFHFEKKNFKHYLPLSVQNLILEFLQILMVIYPQNEYCKITCFIVYWIVDNSVLKYLISASYG